MTMSDTSTARHSTKIERALEEARNSGVLKMDATVGQLLDRLQEEAKKGDLDAAKIKNGGVLVTKCFAFVTGCQ
jgi:hypothetical protein